MALKDWKKISDTKYVNKNRRGTLYIGDKSVNVEIDTIKIGRVNFPQTHINEDFDSHAKAIAYAKDYMRSH